MLMVIFGAGASYDSAPAFPVPEDSSSTRQGGPWRPPLGASLFCDRSEVFGQIVARYPKLAHILPYLRQPHANRTVEQELEFLKEQGKGYPERLRELASVQYYLRDLLFESTNQWWQKTNGVTNYSPLIGDILRCNAGREPVCLVTFNYDLLLDRTLHSYNLAALGPLQIFESHHILKLFRPHGSVDWVRFLDVPQPRGCCRNILSNKRTR